MALATRGLPRLAPFFIPAALRSTCLFQELARSNSWIAGSAISNCTVRGHVRRPQPVKEIMLGHEEPYFTTRTDSALVATDVHGEFETVVLNRPKALNALTLDMVRSLTHHVQRFEQDPYRFVLGLRGAGGRAFCAGGDVKAVIVAKATDPTLAVDFFREEYRLNYLLGTVSKPIIAILDGITMGGGAGLSIHGKYRVATEKTVFSMPETAIGFFPDVGGTFFLSRLPRHLGLYLALTGAKISGIDLLKLQLATHFIPARRLHLLHRELGALGDNHDEAVVRRTLDLLSDDVSGERTALDDQQEAIERCFWGGSVEDIVERLADENTAWANDVLVKLRGSAPASAGFSPTSLKVTLRALHEGRNLDLGGCLRMEFRLATRFASDHDFAEGVRAVLIDKDNKPQWKPRLLENVTDSMVARYFEPLLPCDELRLPVQGRPSIRSRM